MGASKTARGPRRSQTPEAPIQSLNDLQPDPRNANRGTERGRGMLEESIRNLGFEGAMTATRDRVVIAGNKRLEVAAELGMVDPIVVESDGTRPVVVVRTDLEAGDPRAIELGIASNRVAEVSLDWDPQVLAEFKAEGLKLGNLFSEKELVSFLATRHVREGLTDPDAIPETRTSAVRLGDVFELGQHRLLCGDSTRIAETGRILGSLRPDLCLTDPPYCSGGFQESGRAAGSVGTDAPHKQIANDRLSTRGYQALLRQAFSNSLAPYLYAFTDWRMWVWLFDIAESCGYGVRSMIVWDKGTAGMGRGWRSQHELILWGCKDTPPFDKHAPVVGNVIGEQRTGNVNHTTEKPVSLIVALLENTPFAASVIDPFAGSGTTLIACEQTERVCVSIELDPAYCDVIIRRWEEFTGRKAVKVGEALDA